MIDRSVKITCDICGYRVGEGTKEARNYFIKRPRFYSHWYQASAFPDDGNHAIKRVDICNKCFKLMVEHITRKLSERQ